MNLKLRTKILNVTFGTVIISSSAYAKVYVNSFCQMMAHSDNSKITGDNKITQKFPLASISKVVTSLWALETWGPEFRFQTKFHITKVHDDFYDVHIEGGRDPIFGRNASYFIISELNKKGIGVKNIESLTFDENFLIDWLAEEKPRIGGDTPYYETLVKQVQAVKHSLQSDFATSIKKDIYESLRSRVAPYGIQLVETPLIQIRNIDFKSKTEFIKSPETQTFLYRSSPLRTILKKMNNQSNNYVADNLFWDLGGTSEFKKFASKSMSLDEKDIVFYLGSGNNADYILGGDQALYNEATCETMIKVIYRLDHLLTSKGYNLSDVLAVAGVDSHSTVGRYSGNALDASALKTGSVNLAKTLSGAVSTQGGIIYFTALLHSDSRAEWGLANATLKDKLNQLIIDNGGPKRFNYKELDPLPFDKGSILRKIELEPPPKN